MSNTQLTPARFPRLVPALCGLLGVAVLAASFAINPGPAPDASGAQLVAFANRNHATIVVGSWMQGIGSLLSVLFVLALVDLAGAMHRLAGWLTLLAGAAILSVSLLEVTLYLAIVQAAASGDPGSAMVGLTVKDAAQHVFLIAPALLLPVGVVLLGSRLLPRVFGYLALALGGVLQILGLVGLFTPLQPVVDDLLTVQLLWLAAAAIALAVGRGEPATGSRGVRQPILDSGPVP
jgi:Domain of unknown function (DUF4386)